ncbi:hypothetical protein [Sphingomonas koreensis]|uniref:hypothetical protein n=1 Tax=Sphingomonas koreensis TaxID=93064 RepID=UPI000F7EBA5C|nr:hypothetical protein [Sphingomonas koreensis]
MLGQRHAGMRADPLNPRLKLFVPRFRTGFADAMPLDQLRKVGQLSAPGICAQLVEVHLVQLEKQQGHPSILHRIVRRRAQSLTDVGKTPQFRAGRSLNAYRPTLPPAG